MKKYKAICKIDKHEGDNMEFYTLFIKEAEDEIKAHEIAKHYMLTTFPQWSLYKIELKEL